MKQFTQQSLLTALTVFCAMGLSVPGSVFAAGPATVNLGGAGNFVILAKTGISTTGSTAIVGDLGLSPAAASYITGFSLILPAASAFSTSAIVTGKIYAPGYADPSPAGLTTAILDMQTAYTDAMGRASTVTELGAGNIGGLTLAAGVYKWGTGVTIPTNVTLLGGANDVWIFQIAQGLDVGSGAKIILSGGAQGNNIFWVVAGQTTLGTTSEFNGNILDQTAIVLNTGAKLTGRALAQTAVTLDANMVTLFPSTSSEQASVGSTSSPQAASSQTNSSGTVTQTQTTTTNNSGSVTTTGSDDAAIAALQTRINGLRATIQLLQTQQGSSAPALNLGQQVRVIAIGLGEKDKNNEVKILQNFLIAEQKGAAAQALASTGATSYFGPLTRAALAEFQASVGISPALGNFGPITRAYMSAHY